MNEQTLGRLPFAGMTSAIDANHLHLTVDGSAKRSTGHRQKSVRVNVPESNGKVSEPLTGTANHLPVVAGVADAIFAVARDLLFAGQRALEVVRVQKTIGGLMLETYALATLDDGSGIGLGIAINYRYIPYLKA